MRFAFVEDHRGEFDLRVMLRVLEVSKSGYFDWRRGRQLRAARADQDSSLTEKIRAVHRRSKGRYGAPRVLAELRGKGKRKHRATTRSKTSRPVAENVLDRKFTVERPDTVWASDLTYLWTLEGWLYLAVVLDLYSRRVVGWAMGERLTEDLALNALEMALVTRKPAPGLLHHSDRGSQYTGLVYQRRLKEAGAISSMSRKGDCWDNAVVESFFATLKTEGVAGNLYRTRDEARAAVFEFVEVFYNRRRRHSSLGYLCPARFEELKRAA
jgi:transposase InsO family protein